MVRSRSRVSGVVLSGPLVPYIGASLLELRLRGIRRGRWCRSCVRRVG